jgi:hypothetical protein
VNFVAFLKAGLFQEALAYAAASTKGATRRDDFIRGFELEDAWRAAHFAANQGRILARDLIVARAEIERLERELEEARRV